MWSFPPSPPARRPPAPHAAMRYALCAMRRPLGEGSVASAPLTLEPSFWIMEAETVGITTDSASADAGYRRLASRSGGTVDAAVSKTVAPYRACRFESGLRHHPSTWAYDTSPPSPSRRIGTLATLLQASWVLWRIRRAYFRLCNRAGARVGKQSQRDLGIMLFDAEISESQEDEIRSSALEKGSVTRFEGKNLVIRCDTSGPERDRGDVADDVCNYFVERLKIEYGEQKAR